MGLAGANMKECNGRRKAEKRGKLWKSEENSGNAAGWIVAGSTLGIPR